MSPRALGLVANLLTVVRLPLAAALWLAPDEVLYVLVIMAVAAVSDMMDGAVARRARARASNVERPRLDRAQRIGAWLDPLCDKTFVVSVLVLVWMQHPAVLWLVLLIGARELVLVPVIAFWYAVVPAEQRQHVFFAAGPLGKITTVTQFLAIGVVLLDTPPDLNHIAAVVAGILGLLAAVHYIRRAIQSLRVARREHPEDFSHGAPQSPSSVADRDRG